MKGQNPSHGISKLWDRAVKRIQERWLKSQDSGFVGRPPNFQAI